MDQNMALILAITDLIVVVLLLYLLPVATSYIDKSNVNHDQLGETKFEPSSVNYQRAVNPDQLVKKIAGITELLINK